MKPVNQLRSNRGVATSLIETVLVISVTAILASIAMIPALGGMDDAKISKAFSDTELIGIAIHNFAQDITAPPAFKSGQATSPTDDVFYVLETDGEDATDSTSTWPTDTDEIDLMENHLMMNQPDVTAPAYPRRGDISFNRQRGWNGPYLTQLPSSDPWGDKYLANVQFLTPQGVEAIRNDPVNPLVVPTGTRVAVVVLSPGPNRTIETDFAQLHDVFSTGGDDIVFRIQ